MTLGEKIQTARKQAGLTQEQLAKRLCVSRAAIAKWESDAGTPDILNLKALASLFGASMEDLLNEELEIRSFPFREQICLDDFPPSGRCRDAYDTAAVSRFPDAYWVRPAVLCHGLNKIERIFNILTFGLLDVIWSWSHLKEFRKHYYLAETGDVQYFITVDDSTIISTPLPHKVHKVDEFQIDGRTYLLTNHNLIK